MGGWHMADLALNVQNSRLDNVIQEGLGERKILLNFEITDSVIEEISWHILKWNAEDKNLPIDKRKPIIIYINSIGGDVANAFNVINTIQLSKTPVIGVVMGYA
ncbi:MAG: ATP-dependent Clp protease proteolytic subunit, partial [Flavobacteriales bacterium]|nr:ATP-dependent Clp protease proteolytic subunit [Flavobacteriales bacterium]